MKYYEVHAKCGHVGKNNYYVGTIYIFAENGRHAASVARNFPRVKHDQKDAIISVVEISYADYKKGRAMVEKAGYWTSCNIQQQRQNCPELEALILREDAPKKRLSKKHSLRKNFNSYDPMYVEYAKYHGTIEVKAL